MHRRRNGRDRLLRVGVRRQARGPDGRSTGIVAHAELDFGNGRLQLSDLQEAYQIAAPDPKAFATHSVALYCPDVDDVVTRTEQAGATIREPVQTFVTGYWFASILDPFGSAGRR